MQSIPTKNYELPKRAPDFKGPFGSAYFVSPDELCRKIGIDPKENNGYCWVIQSPHSHPFWWWYRLLLLDLSPRSFLKDEPIIHLPGATHEIVLEALNPQFYPPTVDDIPHYVLTPANYASQFIEPSLEAAKKRVEFTVQEIVDGKLSPDTDWIREWVRRYGDNMFKHKLS